MMSEHTHSALASLRDGARRDDLLLQVVVDSGCTFFITPHRHYFIESTIKPTTQTMRGVDGRPTTLLGEGIAVLNIQDPNDNIIYRIAVPALLSSEGITLLSVEQLHQQDGVGYLRPNDDSDAYLFTGNVNNPSRKLPVPRTPTATTSATSSKRNTQ